MAKKAKVDATTLVAALQRSEAKAERDLDQAIDERDAAEEALSQAYYIVTGRSPEWSNLFGYPEALEDIGDAVSVLKQAVRQTHPPEQKGK